MMGGLSVGLLKIVTYDVLKFNISDERIKQNSWFSPKNLRDTDTFDMISYSEQSLRHWANTKVPELNLLKICY